MECLSKNIEQAIRRLIKETIRDIIDETRDRLDEMSRVTSFLNNYEIVVYMNDGGYIPHVHIVDSPTMGKDFDCCVRLDTNAYFHHGHHLDRIPKKMRDKFYEVMCQPYRNPHMRNNYEYAVDLWNNNNPQSYVELKEDKQGKCYSS